MHNYYFDENDPLHPYVFSAPASPGTIAPSNALREEPPLCEGFWPCEQHGVWNTIEDHRNKKGFINGRPYMIRKLGPLPDGWSDTPPPPTIEELFDRLRSFRDARITDLLWVRERHADEIAIGKETTLTPVQYTALLTYIQALRDLPAQPGAPWDGGGELTPWPDMPEV